MCADRSDREATFLSTSEAARFLGTTPDYARRHRHELDAVNLGGGPRPPLRVPHAALTAHLHRREPALLDAPAQP
jgi:hypothetical protein